VLDRAQFYRLSSIPRSISWEEVARVLDGVDRRSPSGKRDWAILMLLITYGLRSREVAALSLDDIDWKRERLRVPERKAGHSTAFPLTGSVGEALADYLQHGRPQTTSRRVFFRAVAPLEPIGPAAVSSRARHYLRLSSRFGGESSVRKRDLDAGAAEVDHRDQRAGGVESVCAV
jgi:integrase/recombinase XerD